MKKQVSPAALVVIVLIVLVVIGGIYFLSNRTSDGHRPTPEQAGSGPVVGGKRLPGAAGAGASEAPKAPGGGAAGAQ